MLVDEALELCDYEPEESEDGKEQKITPKLGKDTLKVEIENASDDDAEPYRQALNAILAKEAEIKATKADLAKAEYELMLLLDLKCYGITDKENEQKERRASLVKEKESVDADLTVIIAPIAEHLADISTFDTIDASIKTLKAATKKADKSQPSKDNKDLLAAIDTCEKRIKPHAKQYKSIEQSITLADVKIQQLYDLLENMGGTVTEEETQELILQKHHSIVNSEMLHYIDEERRRLFAAFENLSDKYAVSAEQITLMRDKSIQSLMDALMSLHYLN